MKCSRKNVKVVLDRMIEAKADHLFMENNVVYGRWTRVLKHWGHRTSAAAFDSWHAHAEEQRRLSKSAGKIVGHWLHRTVSMAYETWHEHAHGQARMRGILRRITERWLHREAAVALASWRESCERQRRAEYITTRVVKTQSKNRII